MKARKVFHALMSSKGYTDDDFKIEQEPVAKYCCRLCFNKSGSLLLDRMILCSECGNKRCPKATNHELQCTNSNAPNQAGSIYNTPPQRTEQETDELQSLRQFRDAAFLAHPNIDLDIEAAHDIKEDT